MALKNYLILVILMMALTKGFSQTNVDSIEQRVYPSLKTLFKSGSNSLGLSNNVYKDKFPELFKKEDAFFCRIERKVDKKAKINSRFRLGDISIVNRLEGK